MDWTALDDFNQEITSGGVDPQQLLLIPLGPGVSWKTPGREKMWGPKARLACPFLSHFS